MAKRALVNPQLLINNELVQYVPDSVEFNDGFGEIEVTSVVSGNAIETVHGRKADTAIGMVKFSVRNTSDIFDRIREWQLNIAENVITLISNETDYRYVLNGASVVNNPDLSGKSDGEIEIELEGDPVVTQN